MKLRIYAECNIYSVLRDLLRHEQTSSAVSFLEKGNRLLLLQISGLSNRNMDQ